MRHVSSTKEIIRGMDMIESDKDKIVWLISVLDYKNRIIESLWYRKEELYKKIKSLEDKYELKRKT